MSNTLGLNLPRILFTRECQRPELLTAYLLLMFDFVTTAITGTWTLPFAAYLLLLSNRVVTYRLKHEKYLGSKLEQGSSGNEQSNPDQLHLAHRAHLNFLENVPMAFIIVLVAELNGGNRTALNYGMATLLALRVMHVEIGMYGKETVGVGRPIGYWGTQAWLAGMAAYGTYLAPLPPPPWTEDQAGIELRAPPICDYCVGDGANTGDATSLSRKLSLSNKEKICYPDEDLESPSSDMLHQLWRTTSDSVVFKTPFKHDVSPSSKRTRLEDNPPPNTNKIKRSKSAKLERVSENSMLSSTNGVENLAMLTAKVDVENSESPIVRPQYVSIFHPLDPDQWFVPSQSRPMPKWMAQLPSSRVKDSILRRPSVPVSLPSHTRLLGNDEIPDEKSGRETCLAHTKNSDLSYPASPARLMPTPKVSKPELPVQRAQSVPEGQKLLQKQPSAFPFFQNPRSPFTPAMESSWGGAPSSGMAPYKGLPTIEDNEAPSPRKPPHTVPQSTEYKQKYNLQTESPATKPRKICPICEESISSFSYHQSGGPTRRLSRQGDNPTIVKGLNGCTYHIACVHCRACRQPFLAQDSMADWTWVGSSSPYHRTCMVQGAKPMLERLKRRLSLAALTAVYPGRQDPAAQMLPGLSRPTPHVLQPPPKASNDIVPKKADYLRNLPTLFSTHVGPEPCASCGHALLASSEIVPGPNATKHHAACLGACVNCGRELGAKGTKWYAYGRKGLIRALCQECWSVGTKRNGEARG
ncbi:hypothetical protein MMC13_003685 [Lambiella insularis]|nr:hypothetical protein [Lambiella insularis]